MPERPRGLSSNSPSPKAPGSEQAKVGPMLSQQFSQAGIVRKNVYRPRFDLCQNARVEVLDQERHAAC